MSPTMFPPTGSSHSHTPRGIRRRSLRLIALGAISLLGLAACSSSGAADAGSGDSEDAAGATMTIRFGNVISVGDTQNQAYDFFAERVGELSDGRLTIEVYPDSQLGGEREMVESTQVGDLEMTAPSAGVLANFDPALQVFDFPFIFEDAETAYKVLDSELGTELLRDVEQSGLVALGWGENGFRNLAMTDGIVTDPAEMRGKKLRTMQVPMHIAYWQSIGAAPTPMAFPEVFTALQQGVVEGVENPFELLHSAKFTEPANYLTETRHIYDPEIILINKDLFESLSSGDQEILQTATDEMIAELRTLKATVSDEVRADIESAGGTVADLTTAERQAWIDSAIPFYKENAPTVDIDKLRQVLEAAGNTTFLDAIK